MNTLVHVLHMTGYTHIIHVLQQEYCMFILLSSSSIHNKQFLEMCQENTSII